MLRKLSDFGCQAELGVEANSFGNDHKERVSAWHRYCYKGHSCQGSLGVTASFNKESNTEDSCSEKKIYYRQVALLDSDFNHTADQLSDVCLSPLNASIEAFLPKSFAISRVHPQKHPR